MSYFFCDSFCFQRFHTHTKMCLNNEIDCIRYKYLLCLNVGYMHYNFIIFYKSQLL